MACAERKTAHSFAPTIVRPTSSPASPSPTADDPEPRLTSELSRGPLHLLLLGRTLEGSLLMTAVMKERIHLERPWEDCPLPLPDALRMEGLAPCLGVVAPMIHVARERVCRGARRLAEEYPRAPFEPVKVEESLAVNLAAPLLAMLNRVLVLELNVARLEGLLDGGTPRDRFLSFAHHLCGTGSKPFLQEYSALRDQIAGRLDRWAEFSLEFLQHLCEDW